MTIAFLSILIQNPVITILFFRSNAIFVFR